MSNIEVARQILGAACGAGVREFCVCSGSRNAPLLAVLGESDHVRLYSFVDERSAAFFAVGRAKLTERPVAVVTTSGTAVAELLPAAIESFYSCLPLVLITADRPTRYRGSGAPQAIEQETLFGQYAARSLTEWDGASPLHLNVEFDEPLIDGAVQPLTVVATGTGFAGHGGWPSAAPRLDFQRPLMVIGELRRGDRDRVCDFVMRLNAPIFAEPLSGLREEPSLANLLITSGERILRRGEFDGVIRIGGVPTFRFWRDLDESLAHLPVMSFSVLPFRGATRGDVWPLDALGEMPVAARDRDEALFDLDRNQHRRFESILDGEPQSELALVRALSRDLPLRSRVYLGNSLPIREWDLAAAREPRGFEVAANRGANGIDGQLSTFFGQCDPAADNFAVVGDLTALYDLNAPWIVPQLDSRIRFRIAIINNGGGRIFERVASLRKLSRSTRARVIDNVHDLRFASWGEMFGISESVIELRPDLEASRRAWEKYEALWE